jgi:hypothetical protein
MKILFSILFRSLSLLAMLSMAGAALADPPARVGRLSYLQGTVDFRADYDADSMPAQPNWPLTAHNVIATGSDGRAELRVGSTVLRLDADSELEIAALDDAMFRLRLLQGSLNGRLRNPQKLDGFELDTAQGRLSLSAPSQFHVDAGRTPGSTVLSLFSGAGRFDDAQSTLTLVAGQRALIRRGSMQVGSASRSDFDIWSLARDQRDDGAASARYVSPEVTGYEDLDQYGSWSEDPEYGAIWLPQSVPAGWAPYRNGRWSWIEPWGWTWIDDAPWGYAPFHYGRWAWFNQRWGWVPGPVRAHPVWAPALVGWVGGQHWRANFSSGSAPAVGWFPLAPHQIFQPAYAASAAYVRQINRGHADGSGHRHDLSPQAVYHTRLAHDAVTVIPHERFLHGRTVAVAGAPALVAATRQLTQAPLSAAAPLRNRPRDGNGDSPGARAHALPRPALPQVSPQTPQQARPLPVPDAAPARGTFGTVPTPLRRADPLPQTAPPIWQRPRANRETVPLAPSTPGALQPQPARPMPPATVPPAPHAAPAPRRPEAPPPQFQTQLQRAAPMPQAPRAMQREQHAPPASVVVPLEQRRPAPIQAAPPQRGGEAGGRHRPGRGER